VLASVPIAAYFPSAMHVYWLTTSMYSLAFTLTMRQPGVRKLLKLAPARVISVPTIMPEKPPGRCCTRVCSSIFDSLLQPKHHCDIMLTAKALERNQ
jgi:hypothetical protein